MTHLPIELKRRIEAKLERLKRLRPLPQAALKKLRQQFEIEMTYNSNAIEGNSLTLKETFLVISEGITVRNKPLKDHLEAKDHYQALEFLMDLVGPGRQAALTEHLVRQFHQLVMVDTAREEAGKYRSTNVTILGSTHKPPEAFHVPQKMRELIEWHRANRKRLHLIELAALFHYRFEHVHPFSDGNGRVGRLLMNVILMQEGYPLAVVLKNDRKKYYDVLSKADRDNFSPLVRFMAQNVERSLDIYLKALAPSKKTEQFHSLSELSRKTRFSAKYLNLLARQGKLEAHKEGRDWLSSIEAVERYLAGRKRKRKRR
ncbi:MAG: Fic family protein [Candidatus Omnitrophota bacterium]